MYEWKQTSIRKSFCGINDRSYPFQLDAAAKQLDLPWPTTSATPSRRLRRQLQLLDAWIIMLTVLYSYWHFAVTI